MNDLEIAFFKEETRQIRDALKDISSRLKEQSEHLFTLTVRMVDLTGTEHKTGRIKALEDSVERLEATIRSHAADDKKKFDRYDRLVHICLGGGAVILAEWAIVNSNVIARFFR